jgi:NodT family efflux transporter outer membrane factor (OMF) lipoprotein
MLAAGMLSLLLAGCTVGPDYQAPAMPLAPLPSVTPAPDGGAARPAPPLDRWWMGFQDPELTQLIGRALVQNLGIKAALARVARARGLAQGAGARLLPAVDATSQALAERQSQESPIDDLGRALVPGFSRNVALYDVGVGASWEMDLFGGLRRSEEAAVAEAAAAEAEQLGVRVSVAADAADAYFQIRGYQARLRVVGNQLDIDGRLLDLVRLQKSKGLASDREVAQAEALLAHAQGTVPLLQDAMAVQMNRLDVLMGAQPGTYAAELASPADIPAIPSLSTQAADLLHRRPDVIAAERRLAAANARIGVATAGYYPRLSLSGLLGFESLDPTRLFQQSTFQPMATAGLRWRLFDFGSVDAEVAQADAATQEELMRYRQTVLHAAEDVENASTDLVTLETHGQAVLREVAALTRARDESQEAYQIGLIPLTDVLDADRQLLVAQDDLPRTRADAARAAVRLYRSLGGGW